MYHCRANTWTKWKFAQNTNNFSFTERLFVVVFAEGTETLLKQFNTRSLIADGNQKLTTYTRAVIPLVANAICFPLKGS